MTEHPLRTPMLRPGLRVTRRDDRTLQVGLEPGRRVLLPDSPETRADLDALTPGSAVVGVLATHGLVVDKESVVAALSGAVPGDPVAQGAVTAAFAQHGVAAPERLAGRAAASVALRPWGAAMAVWSQTAADLLTRSGIGTVVHEDPAATVALVLSDGEPDRDALDAALRTAQPHLLLTASEGAVRLGPFVVPGLTACLRCVDAHLNERDDRRGVVVHQHVSAGPDSHGLPAPIDPALMTMALGWAVRDVLSFVGGDPPSTWSATVTMEPDLALTRRIWRRHPHCGCCWGDLLDAV